ncbi:MAG: nucleotidyltransferase domain-containing protein [Spirochaetales bacterium]|nr:nucleotidyltransferase domain-containing protein [Spirochaetales bacterium]
MTIPSDIARGFTLRLQAVFGGDLAAVILYGSAVRGAYRKNVSDINILVILEKSSPAKIFELGQKTGALMRRRRIVPLIMTRKEFASSADVFPMEYGDILEARSVLFGDERILDISLSRANLRLQLEEKLRGAVQDIRSMLGCAAGRRRLLGKFFVGWSGIGGSLPRALLRLKGIERTPPDAEALLARVEAEYGVSTRGFADLNRFRQGEKLPPLDLAESLLESLKALTEIVDGETA